MEILTNASGASVKMTPKTIVLLISNCPLTPTPTFQIPLTTTPT